MTARTSFSDTSFFYALADTGDRWHEACVILFRELQQQGWRLVTTLFTMAEMHALVLQRVGRHATLQTLRGCLRRWKWLLFCPMISLMPFPTLH